MYWVYHLGGNSSVTLPFLSIVLKRKVKCYNKYFINGHVFHTEEYEHGRKIYNSGVCVMGSTFNEFEVDYYKKLEEIIELQYYKE